MPLPHTPTERTAIPRPASARPLPSLARITEDAQVGGVVHVVDEEKPGSATRLVTGWQLGWLGTTVACVGSGPPTTIT